MRGWSLRLTVLAALIAAPAGAFAQAPADDPETVAARKVEAAVKLLEEMQGASDDEVHALGARLEILAGDEEPVLRKAAEGMTSDRAAIVLACARVALPDFGDVAPVAALVRAGGPEAPFAAGLLGRKGEEAGVAALRAILDDGGASGPARRAAARGLLMRAPQDAPAIAVLRSALDDGDARVVREAALALAEAGQVTAVRGMLRALAAEPTVEGATARAYLRLEGLSDQLAKRHTDVGLLLQELAQKVQEFYAHPLAPDAKTKVDLTYLRDAAARGMLAALDPFSSYLTLEEYRQNEQRMAGSYGGIGAYVQPRPYRGDAGESPREVLTITQPIYRQSDRRLAPAYAAGIRSGDQVVEAIVPEKPAPVDLIGKPLQDCVDLLKGPPGSQVTVWVLRRGERERRRFVLTRAEIGIDTTPGTMLPGQLGYIHIRTFDYKTGRQDLKHRLLDLKSKGARAMLVDLRGNPGGSLDEVVTCVSWFVPKGSTVTTTRGRAGRWQQATYTSEQDPIWTGPVVILTDADSASGSELFSGALHDHKRATVIGLVSKAKPRGETFGKGSGQSPVGLTQAGQTVVENRPLPNRFARLTVFKYYLPAGGSVHKTGLVPDVAVTLPTIPEWVDEERMRLNRLEVVPAYVAELIRQQRELCDRLAIFDDHRPEAYPGFAEFAARVDTRLDAEGLREMVRAEVRTQLADLRAEAFECDFQEDEQLQRGILEMCALVRARAEEIPEYRHFANHKFVEARPRDAATAQPK